MRGHKFTEIKAPINAIEDICRACFGSHAPQEDSSAQNFFPFQDLCSTVCEILSCYVDGNVTAEDQCAMSRVRTDCEWSRCNVTGEPKGCNRQCWSEMSCN